MDLITFICCTFVRGWIHIAMLCTRHRQKLHSPHSQAERFKRNGVAHGYNPEIQPWALLKTRWCNSALPFSCTEMLAKSPTNQDIYYHVKILHIVQAACIQQKLLIRLNWWVVSELRKNNRMDGEILSQPNVKAWMKDMNDILYRKMLEKHDVQTSSTKDVSFF